MLPSTEVRWDLYLLRFVEKLMLLLLNPIQLLKAQNYGSYQRVKHLVPICLGTLQKLRKTFFLHAMRSHRRANYQYHQA